MLETHIVMSSLIFCLALTLVLCLQLLLVRCLSSLIDLTIAHMIFEKSSGQFLGLIVMSH
jgi:hypothetical protein